MDDVTLQKAAIIERCLRRVRDEHAGDDARLDDITRLDAIVLNLQRACEAAIDLAMHRVRVHRLGVPQDSREAFSALAHAGLLDPDLATAMQRMVGFRNIAVHDYQALNLDIVKSVLKHHLGELERFAADMMRASAESR
jgi:uncharacterized protein YutE (UPF0331/DUF86 family)